jgi:PAS domain S-box-containing protein
MTKFGTLLESVPDALVGLDQKGMIRFVNCQTEALFGHDRDELIGQPIEMLVPDPLWQIYKSHREDYFADPRTRSSGLDLELSGRHRDGTQFPVNVSLSHIDTGDVLLVITAARAVDDQQRAVKKAELIAAMVECSDEAIIGITLGGVLTSWNPAAERMYGYSSGEIVGRFASLLAPDDRAGEIFAILAKIGAGQKAERLETLRVRKDGTVFPISLTVSPIHDSQGVVVGASGIGHDMTEREQASAYARSLIEANLDPLVTISPQGKINDVNEAMVSITGCPREALVGSDYSQYVTEPDKAINYFQQALEQGSVTDVLLKVRHRDGNLTDVVFNGAVYRDINEGVLGVLATWHDVTKHMREFEVAQRMEVCPGSRGI